jgi:molybdopterin/thiamine biosynthesis adenylyltransferase
VVDANDLAQLEIHAALNDLGFERVYEQRGKFRYNGVLDKTGLAVPVSIEITDLDFIEYPSIKIAPQFELSGRRIPHVLGIERNICYYARGAVVLDRYDPAGTVLQCLTKCEDVIRQALHGRLNDDFADEFGSYWSAVNSLVDLPEDATGRASVKYIRMDPAREPIPVLAKDSSWLWSRDPVKGAEDHGESALIVRTNVPLSINPNSKWPPSNATELNRWLGWNDPALVGKLEEAIAKSSGTIAILAIRAPNGLFLCRAAVPLAYQTKEFLQIRRQKLPRVLTRIGSKISVERVNSAPADSDYIFGRNLEGSSNLAAKRILLIGCGTIGGFLAQLLAQCGAGSREGELTLVDTDLLYPANLGRHLLGAPYLYEFKASACAEFIKKQLPPLNIRALTDHAETVEIGPSHYDLVIDATGEEALSLALNHRAVKNRPTWPAHMFVWLEGNGAIGKSVLTGNPDHACLKCLKPRLAQAPRHKTLKSGEDVVIEQNAACGDGAYIPFPVSRSVSVAAMACDHVLDWAKGLNSDRFRSRTFDNAKAYSIQDSSPKRSPDCPACGRSNP